MTLVKLTVEKIRGQKVIRGKKSAVKKLTAEEICGEKVNSGKISGVKVNVNLIFLRPLVKLTAEKLCGWEVSR